MPQYLLSVHTASAEPQSQITEEAMRRGYELVAELEAEMRAEGALLFSGRLAEPSAATVVRAADDKVMITDGAYIEAKEHIAGFYIIEAPDLDAGLRWATKTSAAISKPIEVRPFSATAAG